MGGNNVNGDKGSKKKGAICFIFGLVGGTGSSIITKILYTMQAEGVNGEVKPFAVSIASGVGVTNRNA